MWWLLVGAGVAVVAAIAAAVSSDEREARQRWAEKQAEVERQVTYQNCAIQIQLERLQTAYDFVALTDLHFTSMLAANEAHSLLRDARTALDAVGRLLAESRNRRVELEARLADLSPKSAEHLSLRNDLRLLRDFRKGLFDDRDKLRLERDSMLGEVRRLNEQTRTLKLAIRDRCGSRGYDWYARLEARTAMRRLSR